MSSLVNYINTFCPIGVPHRHRQKFGGTNPNQICAICCSDEMRKRYNFIERCPDHNIIKTVPPTLEAKVTAILIFSCKNNSSITLNLDFYLPLEMQRIILKFMEKKVRVNVPINLDEPGIKHMMECRRCVRKFMKWLDKNVCRNHSIPRPELNFYHFDRDYNDSL